MKNISFLNENKIELKVGQSYIVIDALYLMDIKESISLIDTNNAIDSIRKIVFPYTAIPFAEYFVNKSQFSLSNIKKVDYNNVDINNYSFFGTDTGLLMFVNKKILFQFLESFDYGELINSPIDIINIEYWNQLTNQFNELDFCLMTSKNENEDEDEILNGGGTYKII